MNQLKGHLYKDGETVTNYTDESRENLEPGAYVCKIVQVMDDPSKQYLSVEYDIAEGEHAGYYDRLSERAGFWGGRLILSYKDKALSLFKNAIKAINADNPANPFNPFEDGKNRNPDEKLLIGKIFGLVLHEEEYDKNDGTVGTRITASASAIITTEKLKAGKYNKKLLDKTSRRNQAAPVATPAFMDSSDDNPFA